MHVRVNSLASAFDTDDVPQIPHRQMTPTKSHSPREKFWISLIKTENGGRRGKRTAQLAVRSIVISLTFPRC